MALKISNGILSKNEGFAGVVPGGISVVISIYFFNRLKLMMIK